MEPAEITIANACVRMERRWVRPTSIIVAIFALAFAGCLTSSTVFLWIGLVAAVVLLADYFQLSRHRLTTVRVDRHGVRFSDDAANTEEVMASVDVTQVSVRVGPRSFELLIEQKNGPSWEVSLASGQAELEALAVQCCSLLGLSPDQRLMEFRDPLRVARFVVSGMAGALLGTLIGGSVISYLGWSWYDASTRWLVYAIVALATFIVGRATRTIDLTVGADGIVLRGPWRRRYIPYAGITNVTWEGEGILEIHDADHRAQRVSGTSLIDDADAAQAFMAAVRLGKERHDQRRRETELGHLLSRGERTLTQWRASLQQMVKGGSSYRAQALPADEVARLLDDASADAELRVGAALALREMRPSEELTHIRVVAGSCADPAAREALERVVDDTLDDASLAKLRKR